MALVVFRGTALTKALMPGVVVRGDIGESDEVPSTLNLSGCGRSEPAPRRMMRKKPGHVPRIGDGVSKTLCGRFDSYSRCQINDENT